MVHREPSEGKKLKPRGRPFPKGNKRGKLENEILDTSGSEISVEGGAVTPSLNSSIVDSARDGVFHQLNTFVIDTLDNTLKECMETNQVEEIEPMQEEVKEIAKESKKEDLKDLEVIESIDFKNGDSTLSIRFSKRHNRMFRIQVFLNNKEEIRPVTYTGASTGYTFWTLLKGAINK